MRHKRSHWRNLNVPASGNNLVAVDFFSNGGQSVKRFLEWMGRDGFVIFLAFGRCQSLDCACSGEARKEASRTLPEGLRENLRRLPEASGVRMGDCQ